MPAAATRLAGWVTALVSLVLLISPWAGDAEPVTPSTAGTLPPPVEMTAQEDHRRLLDLLKITSLRPGANPRDPQAPNAPNYDEAKANPYPNLPDPLVLKNGRKVTTARLWWSRRRPEIVEEFD